MKKSSKEKKCPKERKCPTKLREEPPRFFQIAWNSRTVSQDLSFTENGNELIKDYDTSGTMRNPEGLIILQPTL